MRKTQEELQSLMIHNEVKNIWSWSKYNTYLKDPYGYLLKYILKVPEDKMANAFSFLGGFTHEVLEEFYEDKLDNDEMVKRFEDIIFEQKLMDIRFATNDEMNDLIRVKYISCIKHFFKNYVKDGNATIEKFVYLKTGNHLFQGYVDKFHAEINEEDVMNSKLYIDDFKTSTMYKGDKAEEEKGQLLLYTIALSEMYNIPYDKITARWNFLKYVAIDCLQVNGKWVTMYAERNDIAEKLKAKMRTWFTKSKNNYTDEYFDECFNEVTKLNKEMFIDADCLKNLPEDVKDKFIIKDALVEIIINEDEIIRFKKELDDNCNEILKKEQEYAITKNDDLFWTDINPKNSFFFMSLCGYSAKHHLPIKKHLESLDNMGNVVFGGKSSGDIDFLNNLLGD